MLLETLGVRRSVLVGYQRQYLRQVMGLVRSDKYGEGVIGEEETIDELLMKYGVV